MIHVGMGIGDGLDEANTFSEKLEPHLGGGVDEQISVRKSEQDAGSGALILGVGGTANLAVAA